MEYFKPKTRSYSVYLSLLAVLTALTTVATIIIAIPFPTSTGYLNFGDVLVMLSGLLLGPIGGFLAGGIGSAMGDVALGYIHFAPITLVVKGCEGLIVGLLSIRVRTSKTLTLYDVAGLILSSLIMLLGYFVAEVFLFGYAAALAELLTLNWIQVTVGSIITALIGPTTRGFLQQFLYTPENEILEDGRSAEFDAVPEQTT
ncbi:MAG: ECF transporter S component [Candidatus Thorarchaeota archaeon]|nr:ECF transporter S component [Candidatus Thorarchaeota archaeon]